MREIISLHIGQAGIQMGNRCWELYGREHGIKPDGYQTDTAKAEETNPSGKVNNAEVFFERNEGERFVPRSLFIDLEPSVIDEIKSGSYGDLFHPDQMITGKEDAANNFARGHYTTGKQLLPSIMEALRRMAERCNGLQGFITSASVGGGTGGGLGSLLLESISAEFGKTSKLALSIFPSPTMSAAVVEPYNAVLSARALTEHSDVTVLLDNEALYQVCKKRLKSAAPGFGNLNRVVAQVGSSLTASLRFAGSLNVDINEFQTNLVPYPRIHFMLASYAPLVPSSSVSHSRLGVSELTSAALEPQSVLCQAGPGRLMAACLLYRGDVAPREANAAVSKLRERGAVSFVRWSPTGFKFGICGAEPVRTEDSELAPTRRAVALVANSTGARTLFSRLDAKFDSLFRRRAFVHWFVGEGMEEGELSEAREDLARLEQDYAEIAADGEEPGEEDDGFNCNNPFGGNRNDGRFLS